MNRENGGKMPNIVLINCDDLGYGDLGCYGSQVNDSSYIDRLAAEGMRFTDYYVAAALCTPSRAAMLTGCYPRRIGFCEFDGQVVLFPGQPIGLHPDEWTIARMLKTKGYATQLVGKWHCGDQPEFLPTRHGFDRYFGLPYSNDQGIMKIRPNFPPLPLMRDDQVIQEQPDQASLTERYTEAAVQFIREHRTRPFFLYLAHMYVHVPLYTPERFRATSRNGDYGAAVACIDWSTGAIMRELERLGLDEHTWVIFTSDNGASLRNGGSNGPLRGSKMTTWEGGQRVPCIMRWPEAIPGGSVCRELVTAMDLLPTIANVVGFDLSGSRKIDGKDAGATIRQAADAPPLHDAFFYYHLNDLEAVRSGNWKLHLKSGELYDLDRDIGETTNVADQFPAVVRALESKADLCRSELGDARLGIEGRECRLPGRVEANDTLTHFDPDNVYFYASYDMDIGQRKATMHYPIRRQGE